MIVLSYFGLLALIPLLVDKDDPEVQWHAKHGLVLTVAWVVLFVVLREGLRLDDVIRQKIRTTIRNNTTPRHVPAKIIAVPEIPRTKSGKIVELAVRSVVHDKPVRNTEALANPEALEWFRGVAELETD